MAGTNPYIEETEYPLPKQAYTLTIRHPDGEEKLRVEPEELPYDSTGRPGSVLEIALGHHIEIDHACGGVVACSTCHVIVKEGFETCGEASEAEEDMLDNAPGLTFQSRLACQCVPNGTRDVVIEVPSWNRNHAKE